MKNLILVISIFVASKLMCQNNQPIELVKISYKGAASSYTSGIMMGIPQATINITANTNVSKIYMTSRSIEDNSIIYQVNYNMTQPPIYNNSQFKLFENNNNVVYLSSGIPLPLKPYLFEFKTENSAQSISPIFSLVD
jgi:hypothetical protein